jgi:hypothetical protein
VDLDGIPDLAIGAGEEQTPGPAGKGYVRAIAGNDLYLNAPPKTVSSGGILTLIVRPGAGLSGRSARARPRLWIVADPCADAPAPSRVVGWNRYPGSRLGPCPDGLATPRHVVLPASGYGEPYSGAPLQCIRAGDDPVDAAAPQE